MLRPRNLVAVLSFCYARQVYGSADIENAMRRNANFRAACQNQIPAASSLRRFRTDNREAIRTCLVAALRFLANQKVTEGVVTKVNQAHLEAEAARRMSNAAFLDAMAVDQN